MPFKGRNRTRESRSTHAGGYLQKQVIAELEKNKLAITA